MLDFEMRSN